MKQFKIVLFGLLVLTMVFIAGCGNNSQESAQQEQNNKITANGQVDQANKNNVKKKVKTQQITVYFPNENGEKLIAARRTIDLTKTDKYTAAVQELVKGPKTGEGIAIIPKQAKLLDVKLNSKGIAIVNFDKNLVKKFVGGSTGETMLVGSVVDTLTNFPEVKSVEFFVEGKQLDTLSGHLDLTTPITRMKDILPNN
ncbi:GerMN domain-containing protein [Pectinatus sottacetonis]|uniref:GerMN domain-containing protein n=1 Tax=Pectinatus sottacetonis TaxID=1002795 RepID=UPI0018C80740|nr:GerMN domain-containing protein [Pectinatus sottacetonis]